MLLLNVIIFICVLFGVICKLFIVFLMNFNCFLKLFGLIVLDEFNKNVMFVCVLYFKIKKIVLKRIFCYFKKIIQKRYYIYVKEINIQYVYDVNGNFNNVDYLYLNVL